MILIEHHLTALIASYLQTAQALSAGVTAVATLPIIVAHERADEAVPQHCIRVQRGPHAHPYLVQLTLMHDVIVNDNESAVTTGMTQLNAARAWLANDTAFDAYLVALTTPQKAGWCLLSNTVESEIEVEVMEEGQRQRITAQQTLMVRVGPIA
jgi:hypothetical protein